MAIKTWITSLALIAALPLGAVHSADPANLHIQTHKQKCVAAINPGQQDLKEVFPDAKVYYTAPTAGADGLLVQSCQITIPKAAFQAQFSSCALSQVSGSNCAVSHHFAGGKMVEFTAISAAAKPSADAFCGFVCLKN